MAEVNWLDDIKRTINLSTMNCLQQQLVELNKCPFCKRKPIQEALNANGYSFRFCQECNKVFVLGHENDE